MIPATHRSSLPALGLALATALSVLAPQAQAGTLRYAEDRAPALVNPLFTTTMSEARLHELIFDGLFSDDLDLRSTPRLVAAWEVAADRMSMTLELRPDVVWHDGKALSAEDVVFTIEAMQDPANASPEAGRVSWIRSARAESDSRVVLEFHEPEYAPEDKLHFNILPAHRFRSTRVSRSDAFRTDPVGTGPMALVSFNEDSSISLARFSNYWDQCSLDEVVVREVADKNYQAKLLMYESVEALVRVMSRDLAALQADAKVQLYPYQTNSWWYLGFNNLSGSFSDPAVREAISWLLDVEDLLAPIGTGTRVSGPYVPSSPFYNHEVPLRNPDPARAAELLRGAGYMQVDGQWQREGEPLRLRVAALKDLESALDVVVNLQSQLQNQGVLVEPEFLDTAEWRSRIWRDQSFDAMLSMWSFDRNEDIYEQFHSGGSRNFVGYANPDVDAMLEAAADAEDPQEKKALLRDVHARISGDTPVVFLWTLDSYAAFSTRVKDVVVHPFYFFTWARDWRVEG